MTESGIFLFPSIWTFVMNNVLRLLSMTFQPAICLNRTAIVFVVVPKAIKVAIFC